MLHEFPSFSLAEPSIGSSADAGVARATAASAPNAPSTRLQGVDFGVWHVPHVSSSAGLMAVGLLLHSSQSTPGMVVKKALLAKPWHAEQPSKLDVLVERHRAHLKQPCVHDMHRMPCCLRQ